MSLEDLYKFGKLEKHKTTAEEIENLLKVAERCVKDSSQDTISLDLRFISAYQAALAAGEALLYCLGYKAPKSNYHFMTWEALRQTLDKSFKDTLILFNDARAKRAEAFYDHAHVTSETEYKEILEEAKKFIGFVRNKIKKEFPALGKNI